ncbi:transcription repressor OFP8-like [Salvia miltiorrhiza]|uniref:transcription repressor OFP8-like n=1 Tax=Salvia miltiorrhiza TaxID=226208 RepID=UPI0025AD86CD|nr:transcription repressor OFP8-like [Salvia miltiorrhiza]
MAENRLKIRIRCILRSCKSKEQISDVIPTHHPLLITQKLPLLSPADVNGRKCPPASPIISPLNNFPKYKKKPKPNKRGRSSKNKCAFQHRFPDCNYVNGLFSSDDDEEEEEDKWRAAVEDSLAVVKRSSDPYSDFRNSMVEMIVEKHIFATKDLENLLRCFLSLNSYHHHKVIVEVFAEIWEAFFSCDHHFPNFK